MKDSREAFVRLANNRVNKAVDAIRLVGNLSNKSNYDYSESDVAAIHTALRDALQDCKKRFESALKSTAETSFRLPK